MRTPLPPPSATVTSTQTSRPTARLLPPLIIHRSCLFASGRPATPSCSNDPNVERATRQQHQSLRSCPAVPFSVPVCFLCIVHRESHVGFLASSYVLLSSFLQQEHRSPALVRSRPDCARFLSAHRSTAARVNPAPTTGLVAYSRHSLDSFLPSSLFSSLLFPPFFSLLSFSVSHGLFRPRLPSFNDNSCVT